MEEWKSIKGYEDFYMVSNIGRVKSLKRRVNTFRGSRIVNEIILKQENVIGGYKRVSLSLNCKQKRFAVHRLVAIHFLDNPNNKDTVNHIDNNSSNNKLSNLEWVTRRENSKHGCKFHGSKNYAIHFVKSMNSYQISVYFNGKKNYLGSTKSLSKAKEIRDKFLTINNIKNKYACH